MTGKSDNCPENGQFLKSMFNNLNDISEGTDEEVTAELEQMGIDVKESKKKFLKFLEECKAGGNDGRQE